MPLQDNQSFRPNNDLNTAVLFIIFNRLDTTKQVFEAIKQAKPPRLYIAADGPRDENVGENQQTEDVRNYVLNNIDWDCSVKTLFQDQNLGCKYAISTALSWFFEHEEMGIILEDDCLPSLSFFWFCEELLIKYCADNRIGMISGRNNFGSYLDADNNSYYFTSGGSIWGWATWKRVAIKYDPDHELLKSDNLYYYLLNALGNVKIAEYYYSNTKRSVNGGLDAWDYQWGVLSKINSLLAITPAMNLIENIGFGCSATHTSNRNSPLSSVRKQNISFPLKHPACIVDNRELSYRSDLMMLPTTITRFKYFLLRYPLIRFINNKLKKRL